MRLNQQLSFSYCLNIHPGEQLADVEAALRGPASDIAHQLSPDQPFGLGLRIARPAASELQDPAKLAAFRDLLQELNFYAFSINGFPYGAFHGTRVKEKVYLPDWSDRRRLDYSMDLFRILAALVPEGEEASVSSVPLGYGKQEPERFIPLLLELAAELRALQESSGRRLHLGLEPEPDCCLETTDETIAFLQQLYAADASGAARDHIGACLDTCHAAMQFEDPAEMFQRYLDQGILISKVQLSAALDVEDSPETRERLLTVDDGVYLHQVKCADGSRWADLPELASTPVQRGRSLRVHAHVPLDWAGLPPLGSTRHTLSPSFWKLLAQGACPHVEVETYTFGVLPSDISGSRDVVSNVVGECRWAINQISQGTNNPIPARI